MSRRQDPRLAKARSYYRLAAKAGRAGRWGEEKQYRTTADRLVDTARRERERRAERERAEKAYRARIAAERKAGQ